MVKVIHFRGFHSEVCVGILEKIDLNKCVHGPSGLHIRWITYREKVKRQHHLSSTFNISSEHRLIMYTAVWNNFKWLQHLMWKHCSKQTDNLVNHQHINPVEKTMAQSLFLFFSFFFTKWKQCCQNQPHSHRAFFFFFTNIQHSHSSRHQSTQFHTCRKVQIGVWDCVSYYQHKTPKWGNVWYGNGVKSL